MKREQMNNSAHLMKVNKKSLLICGGVFAGLIFVGAVFLIIWLSGESSIYKVCRIEAGAEVEVSDFTKKSDTDAQFVNYEDIISTREVGELSVQIRTGWFVHTSTLIVEDTIAPTAETQDVEIVIGGGLYSGGFYHIDRG